MITGTLPVFNLTKEQNDKRVSCYLNEKQTNQLQTAKKNPQQLFELNLMPDSLKSVYFHRAFYSLCLTSETKGSSLVA